MSIPYLPPLLSNLTQLNDRMQVSVGLVPGSVPENGTIAIQYRAQLCSLDTGYRLQGLASSEDLKTLSSAAHHGDQVSNPRQTWQQV